MSDSPYGEGTAELQELLKMRTYVLIGFSTKWSSLHHGNETCLDLEVRVTGVDSRPGERVVSSGS